MLSHKEEEELRKQKQYDNIIKGSKSRRRLKVQKRHVELELTHFDQKNVELKLSTGDRTHRQREKGKRVGQEHPPASRHRGGRPPWGTRPARSPCAARAPPPPGSRGR